MFLGVGRFLMSEVPLYVKAVCYSGEGHVFASGSSDGWEPRGADSHTPTHTCCGYLGKVDSLKPRTYIHLGLVDWKLIVHTCTHSCVPALDRESNKYVIHSQEVYRGYSKLRTRTAPVSYGRAMPSSIGPPYGRCVFLISSNLCTGVPRSSENSPPLGTS